MTHLPPAVIPSPFAQKSFYDNGYPSWKTETHGQLDSLGLPCAPSCTMQVGGAKRRLQVHNVVLYC